RAAAREDPAEPPKAQRLTRPPLHAAHRGPNRSSVFVPAFTTPPPATGCRVPDPAACSYRFLRTQFGPFGRSPASVPSISRRPDFSEVEPMRTGWQCLAGVMAVALTASVARADDWPQWLGPQRDGVWRENGLLAKFPEKGPKVLWRAKVAAGYSGPAVAKGKVYVTDFFTEDNTNIDNPMAVSDLKGKERVLCFDAKSGEQLWKDEYDCHYKISYPNGPRGAPTVHDGKGYTVGA